MNVAAAVAMETWPAYLAVPLPGKNLGTSGATLVAMTTPQQNLLASLTARMSPWLNDALGGGVADAEVCFWQGADPKIGNAMQYVCYSVAPSAAPSPPPMVPGPCHVKALTGPGGSPDTTISNLPSAAMNALDSALGIGGFGVDTAGCIDYYNLTTNTWEPVPSFGGLAYEPSGTAATYNIGNNSCKTQTIGPWQPASQFGVAALLDVVGSTTGSCSMTLTDGSSNSNPQPDAGQVNVGVVGPCGTSLALGGTCILPAVPASSIPCYPLGIKGTNGSSGSSTSANFYKIVSGPGGGTINGYFFTRTTAGAVTLQDYVNVSTLSDTKKCLASPPVEDPGYNRLTIN